MKHSTRDLLKTHWHKITQRLAYEIDSRERVRWALHNGFAHPLMVLLPRTLGGLLHDLTAPKETVRQNEPRRGQEQYEAVRGVEDGAKV